MPVNPTFPGVYIHEAPSQVRAVTGAATSVAAFVGPTLRGPVDDPILLHSFADFERMFGGLWQRSAMSFAIRDFFINGGGRAVVVRVYVEPDAPAQGRAVIELGGLSLVAASPGTWGGALEVIVDRDVADPGAETFNLRIEDPVTGAREIHRDLSMSEGPREVTRVLESESVLIRVAALGELPEQLPTEPVMSEAERKGSEGAALDDVAVLGSHAAKTGMYALEKFDDFNLLCIPPYVGEDIDYASIVPEATSYCEARRALLIVDPHSAWSSARKVQQELTELCPATKNAALYFPRLRQPNPLCGGRLDTFVPCGAIAGVIARTDDQRGVWKAPAGHEATLRSASGLSVPLTDAEIGELNPLGVNCLKSIPAVGRVVWGARTREGDDRLGSQWKYLPVRRLAMHIEESLYRGVEWAVFEPNDERLWAQLRLGVGAFMHDLFRKGAFQGTSRDDAYFVKCDADTTTPGDVDRGVVNVVVGFAPLRPAEFVIVTLSQIAGQLAA